MDAIVSLSASISLSFLFLFNACDVGSRSVRCSRGFPPSLLLLSGSDALVNIATT